MNKDILVSFAKKFLSVGVNILPTRVSEKYPKVKSWSEYQKRMVRDDEIENLFKNGIDGIGVITGAISGNLECIDIDNKLGNANEIFELIQGELEEILQRCIIEKTQNGGYHIFYRAERIDGNQKIAQMKDVTGTKITIIETRGEGGFVVVYPSPNYQLLWGSWTNIPYLSEDEREQLITFCKSFNEIESEKVEIKIGGFEIKPWEDYNQKGIEDAKRILKETGWIYVKTNIHGVEYWRRPNAKTKGIDATFRNNIFYVFSTNASPFEAGKGYSPFGILSLLYFNNNYKVAIEYIEKNGYGKRKVYFNPKKRSDEHEFVEVIVSGKVPKLKVNKNNFLNFLIKNGFGKIYIGNDIIIVKVSNNIVSNYSEARIKDFVFNYIKENEWNIDGFSKQDAYNLILDKEKEIFSKSFLEFLPTLVLNFKRDTRDEAYFFFTNVWVRANESGYQVVDYNKLDGVVWEKQIIPREFEKVDFEGCDFQKFLMNICRYEPSNDFNADRYLSLRTAIGYLLHTYKDPSNAKAIIFVDEGEPTDTPDEANGRSGKSLVGKSIGKLRNEVRIDGRTFKFDKTFAFQSINLDTQLIHFNDVPKRFDFEKLFAIITDSITIEKKNRDEFIIPFEHSPKVLISTNYAIQVDGTSGKDRKFEIEFSNYYNIRHRPIDDFEYRFFDDWTDEKSYEWKKFDNFMINCCVDYFQNGLKSYRFRNLIRKQVAQGTLPEFYDFMENYVIKDGRFYSTIDLFNEFKRLFPEFEEITIKRFSQWINNYCINTGIKFEKIRVLTDRGWKFTNENN